MDKLIQMFAEADELDNQAYLKREEAKVLLDPMFSQQISMGQKIYTEEEFADLRKMLAWGAGSPLYDIIGRGDRITGYFYDNGTFFQTAEYNNGEDADWLKLLPEFVTGTDEEKENAIRSYFRKYKDDRRMAERAIAEKNLAEAMARVDSLNML